jgi:hypothetical protein
VGPRHGLDRCGKSRPTGIFFVKLVLYCFLRFALFFLCTLVSCYAWYGFPMSSFEWGLGVSLGVPLDPCVCSVCCLVGGADFFLYCCFLSFSCLVIQSRL